MEKSCDNSPQYATIRHRIVVPLLVYIGSYETRARQLIEHDRANNRSQKHALEASAAEKRKKVEVN